MMISSPPLLLSDDSSRLLLCGAGSAVKFAPRPPPPLLLLSFSLLAAVGALFSFPPPSSPLLHENIDPPQSQTAVHTQTQFVPPPQELLLSETEREREMSHPIFHIPDTAIFTTVVCVCVCILFYFIFVLHFSSCKSNGFFFAFVVCSLTTYYIHTVNATLTVIMFGMKKISFMIREMLHN